VKGGLEKSEKKRVRGDSFEVVGMVERKVENGSEESLLSSKL